MCTLAKLVVDLTRKETFSMKWNSSPLKSFQCFSICSFFDKTLLWLFSCSLLLSIYPFTASKSRNCLLVMYVIVWTRDLALIQHIEAFSHVKCMGWKKSPAPHEKQWKFPLQTMEEELESLLGPCYCLKQPQPQNICVDTRLGLSTFLRDFQKNLPSPSPPWGLIFS